MNNGNIPVVLSNELMRNSLINPSSGEIPSIKKILEKYKNWASISDDNFLVFRLPEGGYTIYLLIDEWKTELGIPLTTNTGLPVYKDEKLNN